MGAEYGCVGVGRGRDKGKYYCSLAQYMKSGWGGGGGGGASHSFWCLILSLFRKANYTHSIYAKGYIVFVFPFIPSYVCSFVRSFICYF